MSANPIRINDNALVADASSATRLYYGEVKWFNFKNHYGFIKSFELDYDLFVHARAVDRYDNNKKVYLHKGDQVEFKSKVSDKGYEAYDVRKIPKILFSLPVAAAASAAAKPTKVQQQEQSNKVTTKRSNLQNRCELTLLKVAKALIEQQKPTSRVTNKDLKINRFDLESNTKNTKDITKLVEDIYLKQGVRVIALLIDPTQQKSSNIKARILSINQKDVAAVDKGNHHDQQQHKKLPIKKSKDDNKQATTATATVGGIAVV